jgi:hypothetical protein
VVDGFKVIVDGGFKLIVVDFRSGFEISVHDQRCDRSQ